jgi:hypothetical protein
MTIDIIDLTQFPRFCMFKNYRFRCPIEFTFAKYWLKIEWHPPIVKIDRESISIFLNFLDD